MQDRYAGDVGDFLKLGLLRLLTAGGDDGVPLRCGVVWYRSADETHNADGKHVGYLSATHPDAPLLRPLDPDLHRRLAEVVAGGDRSVAALERAGVLAPDTCYFSERLDLSDLPVTARAERTSRRAGWVEQAVACTAGCDLVFVDPDNGLRPASHPVPRHRTRAVKHAYLDELAAYARRGQSIVAYQHADRSAPVEVQARRWLGELARALPLRPLAAVRASRGSARLFLLAAAPAHAARLRARLDAIEAGPWAAELRVLRAEPRRRVTGAGPAG